jgi:hypothetical protein
MTCSKPTLTGNRHDVLVLSPLLLFSTAFHLSSRTSPDLTGYDAAQLEQNRREEDMLSNQAVHGTSVRTKLHHSSNMNLVRVDVAAPECASCCVELGVHSFICCMIRSASA